MSQQVMTEACQCFIIALDSSSGINAERDRMREALMHVPLTLSAETRWCRYTYSAGSLLLNRVIINCGKLDMALQMSLYP